MKICLRSVASLNFPFTWGGFLSLHRLTAFVAKSFAQARAFIPEYIDDKLLEESLGWMARQTNKGGSFQKVGQVHSSVLKVRYLLISSSPLLRYN